MNEKQRGTHSHRDSLSKQRLFAMPAMVVSIVFGVDCGASWPLPANKGELGSVSRWLARRKNFETRLTVPIRRNVEGGLLAVDALLIRCIKTTSPIRLSLRSEDVLFSSSPGTPNTSR